MAAAAAAVDPDEDEEDFEEEDEVEMGEEDVEEVLVRRRESDEEGRNGGEGIRMLARAIERFGKVYERVEAEKFKQMMELEKQRMQFTKDMELQRMRMFMDTQVQLAGIKRGKRSGSNGETLNAFIICFRLLFNCGLFMFD